MPEINSLVIRRWMDTYVCGKVTGYSQTLQGSPLVLFMTNEGFVFVSKPSEIEKVRGYEDETTVRMAEVNPRPEGNNSSPAAV